MKENEVRPIFRVAAAILAIPAWLAVLWVLFSAIQTPPWAMKDLWLLFLSLWFSVSASVTAVRGYVPRILLSLMPNIAGFGVRGIDDKDLR